MMLLEEGVDDGDILAQREIPIGFDDTCATLYERVAETEFEMLDEVLPLMLEGRVPRRKQDASKVTVMPKRRPEDGLIDWKRPARRLYDWVRALTHPYPGAFSHLGGRKVFVWKASLVDGSPEPPPLLPGEVALVDGSLLAGTGEGVLRLERVQAEQDAELSGADFAAKHAPAGRASFTEAPSGVSA
jgi:methionyl-tRNA formyltransferase